MFLFYSLMKDVQELVGDAYRNRCSELGPYLSQLFVSVPGDNNRFVPVIITGAEVILDMVENVLAFLKFWGGRTPQD